MIYNAMEGSGFGLRGKRQSCSYKLTRLKINVMPPAEPRPHTLFTNFEGGLYQRPLWSICFTFMMSWRLLPFNLPGLAKQKRMKGGPEPIPDSGRLLDTLPLVSVNNVLLLTVSSNSHLTSIYISHRYCLE